MSLSRVELTAELSQAGLLPVGALLCLAGDKLPESLSQRVPDAWRELLHPDPARRRSLLSELWSPVTRKLSYCFEPFFEAVSQLAVLDRPGLPPLLIYGLRQSGRPVLWWGEPPLELASLPAAFAPYWEQLPKDLHHWYGLHAEFRHRGGPFPMLESPSNWSWLSDLAGPDVNPPSWQELELEPEQVLIIGTDSGGRYLGVWVNDLDQPLSPALGLIWDSKQDSVQILDPLFSDLDPYLEDLFLELDPLASA